MATIRHCIKGILHNQRVRFNSQRKSNQAGETLVDERRDQKRVLSVLENRGDHG